MLPTTVNPTDFLITLSDGSQVNPLTAAFLPNLEFIERQTVVIAGYLGNRLQPGDPGAMYPVSVTVIDDGSPLQLLTNTGPVSAVGLQRAERQLPTSPATARVWWPPSSTTSAIWARAGRSV